MEKLPMTEDWMRAIEARLTIVETRNAVEEVHRINVETRLNAIEDSLKWLVRLILGAFVLALVAYALKGGFGTA
jgi:hypothetical protein